MRRCLIVVVGGSSEILWDGLDGLDGWATGSYGVWCERASEWAGKVQVGCVSV